MPSKQQCTDHLGNVYASKSQMCMNYKISLDTYNYRIKTGKTVEEALLGMINPIAKESELVKSEPVSDHNGNIFDSIEAMCSHHGINIGTFKARRAAGASLSDALSKAAVIPVMDHANNTFNSMYELLSFWKVAPTRFYQRINKTGDMEYALTGKRLKATDTAATNTIASMPLPEEPPVIEEPMPVKPVAPKQNKNVKNISKLVFPYYAVKFDDGSEKLMTIGELVKTIMNISDEALGANLLNMRRKSGFLTKSPAISNWLELEKRMAAGC